MLASRWVKHFFKIGYSEVTLLFDQVDTQGLSPKLLERSRKDDVPQSENEHLGDIEDSTKLPGTKWIDFFF